MNTLAILAWANPEDQLNGKVEVHYPNLFEFLQGSEKTPPKEWAYLFTKQVATHYPTPDQLKRAVEKGNKGWVKNLLRLNQLIWPRAKSWQAKSRVMPEKALMVEILEWGDLNLTEGGLSQAIVTPLIKSREVYPNRYVMTFDALVETIRMNPTWPQYKYSQLLKSYGYLEEDLRNSDLRVLAIAGHSGAAYQLALKGEVLQLSLLKKEVAQLYWYYVHKTFYDLFEQEMDYDSALESYTLGSEYLTCHVGYNWLNSNRPVSSNPFEPSLKTYAQLEGLEAPSPNQAVLEKMALAIQSKFSSPEEE